MTKVNELLVSYKIIILDDQNLYSIVPEYCDILCNIFLSFWSKFVKYFDIILMAMVIKRIIKKFCFV